MLIQQKYYEKSKLIKMKNEYSFKSRKQVYAAV